MTPNKIVNHSKTHGLVTEVSATALVLAVIVIGYGIAKPPEHWLLLSNEVSASAQAGQMSSAVPQSDSTLAASAAHESQAVTPGQRNGWIDAPRECAPDQGITDACIYN